MGLTIGSLFSGIGGFELGLERAIPNSKTIWQVEQNKYCQGILKKHWPEAIIYNDIREVNHENLHPVNIICGGFPCQDISGAGTGAGIEHGTRSSLWGEMYRLIDELRPRIAVMENVPALLWKERGMHVVLSNLAQIGYNAEWTVISARQFGAPHLRKRVFIVTYPNQIRPRQDGELFSNPITRNRTTIRKGGQEKQDKFEHANSEYSQAKPTGEICLEETRGPKRRCSKISRLQRRNYTNYWQEFPTQSPLRNRNDGVPHRLARLRALGNAIVPQCSEYIGQCIVDSGLINDLL